MKALISGILLLVTSLWVGSYIVIDLLPFDHWAMFPTLLTSFGGVAAGAALLAYGLSKVVKD